METDLFVRQHFLDSEKILVTSSRKLSSNQILELIYDNFPN